MMYDSGKIVTGLIIFVCLVTFPFWYNKGKAVPTPEPKIVTKEKACVEDVAFMKSSHMQILDEWRDEVVRGNEREYKSKSGKVYNKSLTNTCMECHSNKGDFCDKCHDYLSVKPYCWDCHIDSKGNIPWKAAKENF